MRYIESAIDKATFARNSAVMTAIYLDPIYLDHAATTPILPEVREAVAEGMARWANPSSQHAAGRAARAALEDARGRVAAALGWGGEVIFTGGASEALAIGWSAHTQGARYAGAGEHAAVLRHAGAALIALDARGMVNADALPVAGLIAVQQVNNETGVIQPLAAIAARTHAMGALLLADCAQGAGKLPLPPADLIAIAGHKIGAPPGIGALLVRDVAMLPPSGGQERGYRAGTENLPYILGLAVALETMALEAARGWLARAEALRAWFEGELAALGAEVIAADGPRLATIGAYRLARVNASLLLIRADAAGIAISAGSACASGSIKPSHVLLAMGMGEAAAREVFRVSIGRDTSREDLAALLGVIRAVVEGRRRA